MQDVWRPHELNKTWTCNWAKLHSIACKLHFTHIGVWLNTVLADDSFLLLIIPPLDSLQEEIMQIHTF